MISAISHYPAIPIGHKDVAQAVITAAARKNARKGALHLVPRELLALHSQVGLARL